MSRGSKFDSERGITGVFDLELIFMRMLNVAFKIQNEKKKKSIHFSRKSCLDLVKSSVWNIKTVLSHVTQNTVLHESATVRITLYSTYCHPFKFI